MSHRTRTSLILISVFTAYWLIALYFDTLTNLKSQAMISLSTWAFLVVALRFSSREERVQVMTMIGVATIFECFCSLVWGAYIYRLDNIPLFVPPGHGLFYLMALRVSEIPQIIRKGQLIVRWVFLGATGHVVYNLLAVPQPDWLGLVNWVIFLPFILRTRFALLYAVSFAMTMALEFYGTSLGIWAWAPVLPVLGLAAANPPACIGVGYCVMDGLTRMLSPTIKGLFDRSRGITRDRVIATD